MFRQRINIENAAAHGKLAGRLHLKGTLIAEPHQLFSYFIQIEFAVIAQMDTVLFKHVKRQKKVHTSPHTGDDGNFLPLKKCLDDLKPLPDQQISVNVRLIENQVLRRIIQRLRIVQPVILI